MRQFTITGMTCSACSARVERVVKKLPGIDSCAVSLLTNSMNVEGSTPDAEIIAAVVKAGYGAQSKAVVKSSSIHVYGTYDVGLATPRFHEGQPCYDGNNTASSSRNNYGNQPKVFHQRLQESSSCFFMLRLTWIHLSL